MFAAARVGTGALKASFRKRAAAWVRRRQGDDRLPIVVSGRRLYILPTRAGLAFATLVFVMLLGGLNYSNSVALMLTFLLSGFGMIAMHLTHRNLVSITVRSISTANAFVGEHGTLQITLANPADSPRLGIEAEAAGSARTAANLPAGGTARADIALMLARRGRLDVDRIKLSTTFPFGLFRAWTYVHLHVAVLAWPAPRGRREPPAEAANSGNAPALHRAGDEEWSSLREFRSGDSPRQIAWGAYARGRGLLVKTYQSSAAHHRFFDLATVPGDDLEARLEQLSAWIVAAHARGERFGLRLGAHELPPGGGNEHRARCLNGLALYGSGDPW